MSTLAFILDAPLQSWGHQSQFQRRDTGSFPSKSAVIGLLAAACGIDRHAPDEAERLLPLAARDFTAVLLPRVGERFGRPVTRQPRRLEDYHTIGGGYAEDDPWQRLCIPRKAERGGSFGTVLTRRTYLCDARFGILLKGDPSILAPLAEALADPVWGVWLGRKCCLPATPVRATLHDSPEDAQHWLLARARVEADWDDLPRSEELPPDRTSGDLIHDQPVSFAEGRRTHAPRRVYFRREPPPPSPADTMFEAL